MATLQSKTPCIEGKGHKNKLGYYVKVIKRKPWLYHRLVWTEHYGDIPKGMMIRHLCHNPSCCNIEHLAIGTSKDNREDDIDAGNGFEGVKNPFAKLTEDQAREILSLKPIGKAPRGYTGEIAEKFNIHPSNIQGIWARRFWKHL